MDIFQAIILGIVQGITEWLPISSSGHLVIFHKLFYLEPDILYDLSLHFASVLAVIILFSKDLLKIISAWIKWQTNSEDFKTGLFIIVAGIPTAIIGILFEDYFEKMFDSLFAVGIALLLTGIILYLTKYFDSKKEKINFKSSLIVGIAQGISIIPGISRSGSTIAAGIFSGVKKEEVARFSFLLAIPTIMGAFVLKLINSPIPNTNLLPIIIGTLSSFIVSLLSIKFLLGVIRKGKLYYFSFYCWIIGIVVMLISLSQYF